MAPPATPTARAISAHQQQLVEAIQASSRSLKSWIGAEARREGIGMPGFWILNQIVADEPVNVTQLAESCSVTSAHISTVLDELVELGLADRQRPRSDRRVVEAVATAQGRALLRTIWTRVAQEIYRSLHGVDDREIAAAARVLLRLAPPVTSSVPRAEVAA